MGKKFLIAIVVLLLVPSMAWSLEVYRDGDTSLGIGYFGQAWYQWVEDGQDSDDADALGDKNLNDFMIRRSYLSVTGSATPMLDFFVHYALDCAGKSDGATGVTTGNRDIELRDGYMRAKLLGEALMVNLGRMYVPVTRTPSTKCLMMIDVDWTQGGVRGDAFFPSKACNRDDGVMVWGNLANDMVRYRAFVGEGIETNADNPDDNLRYAGQVSLSLLEPEKGYFNPQTYMGKKDILSILASIDHQSDLSLVDDDSATPTTARAGRDYTAWTAEVHCDYGPVTVEAAYIDIHNKAAGTTTYTNFTEGDDATIISAKAGYILPNNLQLVGHYENVNIDSEKDSEIYGGGFNYFIKGHANKFSVDVTNVEQEEETATLRDHQIVTVQLAVGF
ncbi:MAG: selenite/tellurite reduction operon porin ExtI [Pseudomonadota bacterium]